MADRVIPVKVAARVRPFVAKEVGERAQDCMQCFVQQNQLLINDRCFAFDYVFDPSTSQEGVYDSCGAPLLDQLFNGYNCTVFAYGQTGSGKTFTMGTEETEQTVEGDSRGIIPRIVGDIFERIGRADGGALFSVVCSMLEIYEERVLDLLGGAKEALNIRETNQNGVFVQGLTEAAVDGLQSTVRQLQRGCAVRSKGETAMNAKSSRSHAVFTLSLTKTAVGVECVFCHSLCRTRAHCSGGSVSAKLHLVDLAGSERLKKTQSAGERMREGIKINEGLLALGNVISALTEPGQTRQHIPYRDSKLTRLLQDSLGGNSHTIMIACVSPADSNCDETISTLRYAERAKKIKNKPIVNQDPNAAEIQRLRHEVQRLTHELVSLRSCEPSATLTTMVVADAAAVDGLQRSVDDLQMQNARLQRQLAEQVAARAVLIEKLAIAEVGKDRLQERVDAMKQRFGENICSLESSVLGGGGDGERERQLQFMRDMEKELPHLLGQTDAEALLDLSNTAKQETDEDEDAAADEQYPERFVERQSAVSREMEQILAQIREKECLIEQTARNHQQFDQIRQQHQKDVDELQQRIASLEGERDKLNDLVRKIGNSNKVSEERRKRLQDLEREIAAFRRKLVEMNKLEKLKVQSDLNVGKLREEILSLKQMRVKLVKQLRDEGQRFNVWKQRHERELNQVKQKERRTEVEAKKAKVQFDQQLTVYRRKYEAAAACSKRLQQQLQRREITRNQKFTDVQDGDRLYTQVKKFLEQELEFVKDTEEARLHCDNLIQQRKEISQQLERKRRKLERLALRADVPPAKKRQLGGGQSSSCDSSSVDDEAAAIGKDVEHLENEIALRNSEIKELQQKFTSYDADTKEDQRWAQIYTTVHAKCALKQLFQMAVGAHLEKLQSEQSQSDVQAQKEGLERDAQSAADALKSLKQRSARSQRKAEQARAEQEQQAQATIYFLLNCVSSMAAGRPMDDQSIEQLTRLRQECGNLLKMEELCDRVQERDAENKELNNQLSRARQRDQPKPKMFRQVLSSSDLSSMPPPAVSDQSSMPPPAKRTRSSRLSRPVPRLGMTDSSSVAASPSDDSTAADDDDSDYRDTPVRRRGRPAHASSAITHLTGASPIEEESAVNARLDATFQVDSGSEGSANADENRSPLMPTLLDKKTSKQRLTPGGKSLFKSILH